MKNAHAFSAETVEHYTPPEVLAIPQYVCGGIDLDLCSCQAAQQFVKAKDWFGPDHPEPAMRDGLAAHHMWYLAPGTWWCNPPGGRIGRKSSAFRWWDTASHAQQWCWNQEDIQIDLWFLIFNFNLFQVANKARQHPLNHRVFVFDKRIDYLTPNRRREVTRDGLKMMEWFDPDQPAGAPVRGGGAPHPSALVWVGTPLNPEDGKRDRALNLPARCAPGRWFGL